MKPTRKYVVKKEPKVVKPKKPLKRPPLFPSTVKKEHPPAPLSDAAEQYINAPVFLRLQQRNTNAFTNYMTSSISNRPNPLTLAFIAPLNARSRSETNIAKMSNTPLAQSQKILQEAKLEQYANLLATQSMPKIPEIYQTEGGTFSVEHASVNLKKKINSFDNGM